MTDDDYKELMLFHILLETRDLSEYKYAAVDQSGQLTVFTEKPSDMHESNIWSYYRTTRTGKAKYIELCVITKPPNWKETLICL